MSEKSKKIQLKLIITLLSHKSRNWEKNSIMNTIVSSIDIKSDNISTNSVTSYKSKSNG